MNTEYETKILNADIDRLIGVLNASDLQVVPRFKFQRRVYDSTGGGWIRLRTDGNNTTLTYKHAKKDSIDGVEEIEVEVSSFEDTHLILEHAGLKAKNYQENFRTIYQNDEIEITIDEWPLIEPYVEIEGQSIEAVEKWIELLGLNDCERTSKPTSYVYERAGIDLHTIKELRFS